MSRMASVMLSSFVEEPSQGHDAGVVDQDIQWAVDAGEKVGVGLLGADVERVAVPAQCGRRGCGLVAVEVTDPHRGAIGRERLGGGQADATGRAGHRDVGPVEFDGLHDASCAGVSVVSYQSAIRT